MPKLLDISKKFRKTRRGTRQPRQQDESPRPPQPCPALPESAAEPDVGVLAASHGEQGAPLLESQPDTRDDGSAQKTGRFAKLLARLRQRLMRKKAPPAAARGESSDASVEQAQPQTEHTELSDAAACGPHRKASGAQKNRSPPTGEAQPDAIRDFQPDAVGYTEPTPTREAQLEPVREVESEPNRDLQSAPAQDVQSNLARGLQPQQAAIPRKALAVQGSAGGGGSLDDNSTPGEPSKPTASSSIAGRFNHTKYIPAGYGTTDYLATSHRSTDHHRLATSYSCTTYSGEAGDSRGYGIGRYSPESHSSGSNSLGGRSSRGCGSEGGDGFSGF